MKKLITLVAMAILLLSALACRQTENHQQTTSAANQTPQQTPAADAIKPATTEPSSSEPSSSEPLSGPITKEDASVTKTTTAGSQFTARQKAWALAASAVLTERNKHRHDLLGGVEMTDECIVATKQSLSEWWGITTREDLLRTLEWINEGGHRQGFEKAGRLLSSVSAAQFQEMLERARWNKETQNQMAIVRKYYKRLGTAGLLGWDYSRYISLCRWGYVAGFLTEEEAWAKILPAARLLRKQFHSWKELGENYLIGRAFWSAAETNRNGDLYQNSYHKLLTDTESCWNQIPWTLSMD